MIETRETEGSQGSWARRGGIIALVVLALAVVGVPAAMLMANRDPGDDSVEAGFLRDMVVHHEQAVEMALIIRDRTGDEQLRFLSTDILLAQQGQVGMMNGWLQLWDLSPNLDGPHMAWMDHEVEGLMPGMATPEQIERLRTLPVDEAEVLFLQLMITHHQSAVDMAEAYLERGDQEDVAAFARNVIAVQDMEIDALSAMLDHRGAGTTATEPEATPGASPAATPAHEGH
jgi:uncharacterized protein (DUF305 family)